MSKEIGSDSVLFIFAGTVAFLLMAGYRSQLMAFVSWGLLISLDTRNQYISQGGDLLLRMLLFWAMFLPIGARFSFDAAVNKTATTDNQNFSFASLGLLVQVISVYFFTALLKDDPTWIPDGTAVYYAMSIDTLVTPIGEGLRQFPTVMSGLTYFVWYLEILAPLLVFSPFFHVRIRLAALALLIPMHIGFFACMYIGLFPLISITALLALTPGTVWDWLAKRIQSSERTSIRIYYDGECLFCEKICRVLRTLLILPAAEIAPAQSQADIEAIMREHNSWVVYDYRDNMYLRWPAVAWLISQSPLLAPIGRALASPKCSLVGERFYVHVAANRYHFSDYSKWLLPYREIRTELAKSLQDYLEAFRLTPSFSAGASRLLELCFQHPDAAYDIVSRMLAARPERTELLRLQSRLSGVRESSTVRRILSAFIRFPR